MEYFDNKAAIVQRNMQEETLIPSYAPNLTTNELGKIFHPMKESRNNKIQVKSRLRLQGMLSNPYKKKIGKQMELEAIMKSKIMETKKEKLQKKIAKQNSPMKNQRKKKSLSQFIDQKFSLIRKLPPKPRSKVRHQTAEKSEKRIRYFRPTSAFKPLETNSMRKIIQKRRRPITTNTQYDEQNDKTSLFERYSEKQPMYTQKDIDYEIELLNNLLTADHSCRVNDKRGKRDAQRILLDKQLKSDEEQQILVKYDLMHGLEEDRSYLPTADMTRANTKSSYKSIRFFSMKKESPSQKQLLEKKNKFEEHMKGWQVGTVLTEKQLKKHLRELQNMV